MKTKLASLSFLTLCLTSRLALGTQALIFIKDLGFDPQSKEFRVTYTDPSSHLVTTLKDSGHLQLCVVEQLLNEYYRRMSNSPAKENNPDLSDKHMVLLNRLAAMLPQSEGEQIRESLRHYIQNYRKGGGPVLKTVREVSLNIMKDRKVSVLEETSYDPKQKEQIENEIKRLTSQLSDSKKYQNESPPNLKTLLLRSMEGKLIELKRSLLSFPSKSSKTEKQILALESIFCAAPLPPFILQNNEIGGLIDKLTEEVTNVLPKPEMSQKPENETHF